ncbi:MAG: hypothetical protein SGBAC_012492 [Bacillariaceae sp.]
MKKIANAMTPYKTTTSIDSMFDQQGEVDASLVGSMYLQLKASSQTVSLNDHLFTLTNERLTQDTLTLLSGIEVELPNHSTEVAYKQNESASHWGFLSSDLEPTPIKLDINQQRVISVSFQDESSSGADTVLSTFASKHCNSLQDSIHQIRPSSTISQPQRTNKRSKTKHAKKKRMSKQPTFRAYQQEQFQENFEELVKFKEEFGHCLVPHTYKANEALSRWVKRQRYQYKILRQNKNAESTMTQERIIMLESIGFVWDSHKLAWQDRFKELEEYKKNNGDCDVPSNYRENPALATWVKGQRRQYKRFRSGVTSKDEVLDRITSLDALGFNWERRP